MSPAPVTMTTMDVDGSSALRRRTLRVWFAVGVVALAWVAWELLGPVLAVVVPPILLAVVIVYLLNPMVTGLEVLGAPRLLGTAVAYFIVITVVAVPAVVGLPLLSQQATTIWQELPATVDAVASDLEAWLGELGFPVDLDPSLAAEDLPAFDAIVNSEGSRSALAAIVGGISGLATGLLRLLLVALLGPVIAFYVLVDLPRLRDWSIRHLPPRYRLEATVVGRELSGLIGGYLRGQLLVALFVGAAVSLGMWLIDLPFWLVVGIVAGVTNLVPLLGPFVAGVLGGAIALSHGGFGFALLVIGVLTVVQQLDNHLVSPLVMGQTVQLHPLMVLIALLVGGTLYGFVGLLVAVPLVAAFRVVTHYLWNTRVPWAADEDPFAFMDDSPATAAAEVGEGDVPEQRRTADST